MCKYCIYTKNKPNQSQITQQYNTTQHYIQNFLLQLCLYMANFLTIRQFHFKLITQCSQLMDFARNLVCCRYKYQELLIQGQYGTNMTQ